MKLNRIPLRNIKRKPTRTVSLGLIVLLMALTLLGGTLTVRSLKTGLNSLETRLGADIIVVPDTARSKVDLENIIMQGVPGYFYMDAGYVERIARVEGVERVSPQYYLASVSAGCCSMPVQIIGFDPETDFAITPWIRQSSGAVLGKGDVVVGSNINQWVGGTLSFYGAECRVVAKLDKTGTELDNAVYGNVDTVKELIAASVNKGMNVLAKNDPDKIVSTVMVKVKDGYDITEVMDYINIYIRHVQAVETKNMTASISDSLNGIAQVIRLLMAVIWLFVLVLLFVIFAAMIHERKREFAVYRVLGMSRGRIAGMVFAETLLLAVIGSVSGCGAAVALLQLFGTMIEDMLSLPFLLPGWDSIGLYAALTIVASAGICTAAAAFAAVKLSRVDAGLVLREGN